MPIWTRTDPQPTAREFRCIESFYMREAHDYPALLRRAQKALEGVECDTLVGTGLSGTIVVPRLADDLGIFWLIVRKKGDGSHSQHAAEGRIGRRWVFVDDFISSGTTRKRVIDTMTELTARMYDPDALNYLPWESQYVGDFMYAEDHRTSGFCPPADSHA